MPKTNTPLLTYPFKSQQIFPNIQTMKNKASKFLKNLFSVVVTLVKAKSIAMRTKTAGLKTRFLILGLFNSKKVPMTTISHKMHAFLSNERDQQHGNTSTHNGTNFAAYEGALVPRKAQMDKISTPDYFDDMDLGLFEEGDEEYPHLTHSLFNSDDEDEHGELELASSSIPDFVKSSRKDGSSFNLEDEIDQVADVFIRKVLSQRRLQHQDSLERSQEMNT
ncbi:hypothetical protein LUZ62_022742 [Rhynchospora pubera]|uniref:Uncharacterized protein n=1 Tax=Rhynchospora pubera TaxID=906938 RepID=A0AAV8H423_9POAL|nr:hypothetical protein LUZ62_022742 [Rhynchospora pubera]